MKKIAITLILLAVVVGAFFFFRSEDRKTTEYETTDVKKGAINNTVTATGTIEPIKQVEVGTQVSGTISRIYVDYNSIVKKGEVIAELDRTLLQAELASQTANLKSSKNEYDYQLKNYDRVKGLHDKKLVSDTEFETAQYQYEKAKQTYDKAKSDLVKAQTNLSYATISSPIDGVVLSRAVDEGQTVASSFNTPTLFAIANDLRKMQVIANVDEADIGQVQEGQRVTFYVDAFPDNTFDGNVTQVRLLATTTSNVVTYQVVVDAPNPDLLLKPGLTANITIYTMEKDDALLVPLKAFRFTPDAHTQGIQTPKVEKGQKILWAKTNEGVTPKAVKIGVTDGIYAEAASGLQEGDQVIVGIQKVKASDSKEKTESSNPFMPQRPGQKKK